MSGMSRCPVTSSSLEAARALAGFPDAPIRAALAVWRLVVRVTYRQASPAAAIETTRLTASKRSALSSVGGESAAPILFDATSSPSRETTKAHHQAAKIAGTGVESQPPSCSGGALIQLPRQMSFAICFG